MAVTVYGGKLVIVGGKIGTEQSCCCGGPCTSCPPLDQLCISATVVMEPLTYTSWIDGQQYTMPGCTRTLTNEDFEYSPSAFGIGPLRDVGSYCEEYPNEPPPGSEFSRFQISLECLLGESGELTPNVMLSLAQPREWGLISPCNAGSGELLMFNTCDGPGFGGLLGTQTLTNVPTDCGTNSGPLTRVRTITATITISVPVDGSCDGNPLP